MEDETLERRIVPTKIDRKMSIVSFSMAEGEELQTVCVLPKEAKRIINEFKETGKISFPDIMRAKIIEVEPMIVIQAHVSDFYIKPR